MDRRHEIPGVNRRVAIFTVVAAVVLALGAAAIVTQAARWGRVRQALDEADKPWLAVCPLGLAVAYLGYILAYRDLARMANGPRLTTRLVIRVVMIGFGATVLGASAGGLGVDFWALNRAGSPPDDAPAGCWRSTRSSGLCSPWRQASRGRPPRRGSRRRCPPRWPSHGRP